MITSIQHKGKTRQRTAAQIVLAVAVLLLITATPAKAETDETGWLNTLESTGSNWSIKVFNTAQSWLSELRFRPASYNSSTLANQPNPDIEFADKPEHLFFSLTDNNAEGTDTGWQVTPYYDEGVSYTNQDDSFGLSFTRQW